MENVHLAPGADRDIEDGGSLARRFVFPTEQANSLLQAGKALMFRTAKSALFPRPVIH